MSYPTIRRLIADGSLVLLQDYRSGHCASFVRDGVGTYRDAAVAGALCRFRTGCGFETCHNCLGSLTNLMVDGDMEAVGVAAWSAGSGGILSKEVGTPHGGLQCLRVTASVNPNPRWPNAHQHVVVAGRTYIITGYARSDGTQVPYITENGNTLWTGTNSVSWQKFTVIRTALGTEVGFVFAITGGTGVEYCEWDDIVVNELSASDGYLRMADSASWYPPADGCCIIASYVMDSALAAGVETYMQAPQIIGQATGAADTTSWALRRDASNIYFVTSDGTAFAAHTYALAYAPGVVETVVIKYDGGTGANNSTIYTLAPTVTSNAGTINRVPGNSAQLVGVGSLSNYAAGAFHGTLRYVAFVRGSQTAATLAALAAEIEAFQWPLGHSVVSDSYLVADREAQYVSRWGVDRSIANETGATGTRISNTDFYVQDAGVTPPAYMSVHGHIGANPNSFEDVVKGVVCNTQGDIDVSCLYLPITWGHATAAEAAYGTWDFSYFFTDPAVVNPTAFWSVSSTNDQAGNGYRLRTQPDGSFQLHRMPGSTLLGASVAGILVAGTGADVWRRIRITRTLAGVWNVYFNYGTAQEWIRIIGPVTDNTHVVSNYFMLAYMNVEEVFDLGRANGERAFYKWAGVVNPI